MCEVLLAAVLAVVPVDRLLEVRHDAEHGRCSEGSVIDLGKDGLLFAYTRYGKGHGDHDDAQIVTRRSSDGGRTWTDDRVAVEKPAGTLNVMSASLLRMKDGRIALFNMLKNDTADARPQMRVSSDGGETWGEWTESPLVSPLSPAQIVRLRDGRLCAAWNDHSMFPEMKERCGKNGLGGRTPMVLGISRDGGRTWPIRCAIENDLKGYFAYPSVREVGDDLVLSYSCFEGLKDIRVVRVPLAGLRSASL